MNNKKTKKFKWDYNQKSDILNIHAIDKKTAGSAELGDFTIDFDNTSAVVGIEIINASEFFHQAGIEKEQLIHLEEVTITMTQKNREYSLIWVTLKLPQNIERTIPLPTPIISENPVVAIEA